MEHSPQKQASAAAPFDSAAVEAKRLHDQVVQTRRRHLLPRAFVAGILAGLLGVAFRLALEWGGEGRSEWLGRMRETLGEAGWIVTALLCAIAGAVAVWLVKQFAPEASGSGIPHVKAVISGLRTMRWIRTTLVKLFRRGLGDRLRHGARARGADCANGRGHGSARR
ncbi:chloride channel protein [Kamptonema cortianum]|nr:chloride channel protein [Kamptonema cortianum]